MRRANDRDQWYPWGDPYAPVNGRLHLRTGGDITGDHWTEADRFAYTRPLTAKHATTCPLAAAEHTALLDPWGIPTWHRVRSSHHPDRFLRHAGFAARLDVVLAERDGSATFAADATCQLSY